MTAPFPHDQAIKAEFSRVGEALAHRYALEGGCTLAQVLTTARDLRVTAAVLPYLCARFVADADLLQAESAHPEVCWEEVKNRASRLAREQMHVRSAGGDFYSGIGPSALP